MREVRYRTEAFSGLQEREAAKVMAFETFELGNTDILEYVSQNLLNDPDLINQCNAFIKELEDNGFVDDMFSDEKEAFFQNILTSIEKETGVSVRYVLWLADKDTVTDRRWYGKDMQDEEDFDCYEVGPVILSDLGFDGTLYGYTDMPVRLEDRICDLRDQMTDIINMRESSHLSRKRAAQLDDLYLKVDADIQEIDAILSRKTKSSALSKEDTPESSVKIPEDCFWFPLTPEYCVSVWYSPDVYDGDQFQMHPELVGEDGRMGSHCEVLSSDSYATADISLQSLYQTLSEVCTDAGIEVQGDSDPRINTLAVVIRSTFGVVSQPKDKPSIDETEVATLKIEISNLRHELDGALEFQPDFAPVVEKWLVIRECQLEAAMQGINLDQSQLEALFDLSGQFAEDAPKTPLDARVQSAEQRAAELPKTQGRGDAHQR